MYNLFEVIARGDGDEVESLLKSGANPDATDKAGRTPLMYAVIAGNNTIIDLLLQNHANSNIQDNDGYSALHFAAQEFQKTAAKRLLEAGAKVDLVDVHGNTPLWRAVFNSQGRGELITLLLSHGANRHATNKSGRTPEDLANTIANYDVKQFFR